MCVYTQSVSKLAELIFIFLENSFQRHNHITTNETENNLTCSFPQSRAIQKYIRMDPREEELTRPPLP